MRRLGSIVVACSLLALHEILLPAAPACADPRIELSWNACDPVETVHPVVGADRKAHLFVSVDGLSGKVTALQARISIHTQGMACGCSGSDGATVPPAWSFEAGGCQGPERVASTFGPTDGACPRLLPSPSFTQQAISRDSAFCFPASCGSAHEVVTLDALAFQPWLVVSQTKYSTWRVDFDLSSSCSFSGGDCCPEDESVVLVVSGLVHFEGGSKLDLSGSSVGYSVNAVPAQPTSWGKVKVSYR